MVAERRQLDNTIEIVTPENIAFRYQVAGPFRRLPAYLIDMAIRVALFWGVSLFVTLVFGLAGLPLPGFGLVLVFLFALEWFYGGLFEAFWNGQTPGKRLMHIRVLTIDGQPIGGLQAVLRNVLRVVDQQPVTFCLLGLVAAALSDRFQRLGDLACGTMVVLEERPWFFREDGVIRVDHPEAIRLAQEVPASFQAGPTLARTLANYVERRAYFPPLRRLDIARQLAEPLREQFNLPPNTNPDLLLCALYRRTFVTDGDEETSPPPGSPFQQAGSPFALPEATSSEGQNKNENAAAASTQHNLTGSATEK